LSAAAAFFHLISVIGAIALHLVQRGLAAFVAHWELGRHVWFSPAFSGDALIQTFTSPHAAMHAAIFFSSSFVQPLCPGPLTILPPKAVCRPTLRLFFLAIAPSQTHENVRRLGANCTNRQCLKCHSP